jgi:hypothetical protein
VSIYANDGQQVGRVRCVFAGRSQAHDYPESAKFLSYQVRVIRSIRMFNTPILKGLLIPYGVFR